MAGWRAPWSFQQHMLDHVCFRRERHYNVMANSVFSVKTLSVLTVYEDDAVSHVHCARGPCMSGPRESLALCQMALWVLTYLRWLSCRLEHHFDCVWARCVSLFLHCVFDGFRCSAS